jgi:hypothetical protein
MSTGIIVGIVVAVIGIGAVVFGVMPVLRRRRLQQRFGPEYDRVVGERNSRHKAEAELTERERRVADLDIQPLTDSARASYAGQWTSIQERFVDAPADAVSRAQLLVAAVMTERGYPADMMTRFLPTCPSSTQAPLTTTGRPRRSARGPPRARPPPRTCGKPWSTTVPCSVTSSASPRIPDPNQPPPRTRASNSLNLTRKRWRNDLTKRDGNKITRWQPRTIRTRVSACRIRPGRC